MENSTSKIQAEAKNPCIVEGDTVRLLLHGGEIAVVDLADFAKVAHLRWSPDGHGYAQTRLRQNGKILQLRLHRFLLEGLADGLNVDHANGCRWDCRRVNLRACLPEENKRNRSANSANKTGYKGVRWNASSKTYFVQIKKGGNTVRVGKFDSPEEAARGYDFLARAFFGEFARLNFPPADDKDQSLP